MELCGIAIEKLRDDRLRSARTGRARALSLPSTRQSPRRSPWRGGNRLPYVDPGANRAEQSIEALHRFVEWPRLGDRHKRLRPRSISGDHSHQRSVRLVQIVGKFNRETPARRHHSDQPRQQPPQRCARAIETDEIELMFAPKRPPSASWPGSFGRERSKASISACGNRRARSALIDPRSLYTSAMRRGARTGMWRRRSMAALIRCSCARRRETSPDRGNIVHWISPMRRGDKAAMPQPDDNFDRAASLGRRLAREHVDRDRDRQAAGLIDVTSILSPALV